MKYILKELAAELAITYLLLIDYLNERRMLYYSLMYPLPSYGIVVWGQSAKVLTRQIFTLQKLSIRYTA
jgi:hypothetical protein